MNRPLVSLCNPENRRAEFFRATAAELGFPVPAEIAWLDLLEGRAHLAELVPPRALVRIESPGENGAVEEALVRLGEDRSGLQGSRPLEHGEIGDPAAWFRGFSRLLERVEAELGPREVSWMNHPAEIPLLFDKTACQQSLRAAGLPVPNFLGSVTSFEHLRRTMRELSLTRVFVKLRYGSSASGVVALETSKGQIKATTSVEMAGEGTNLRLFNSLRVRRYTREPEVAALIDELCRREVHVETWVPKAGWRGSTFDLRVMVIGGKVQHVVMRTSRGPITNLHLGNRRGDVDGFLAELPAESREAAWESCHRVAAVFPHSLYFGIDLLFLPGFHRHVLLEVNAFGDLLPGVRFGGMDTYRSELAACQGGR